MWSGKIDKAFSEYSYLFFPLNAAFSDCPVGEWYIAIMSLLTWYATMIYKNLFLIEIVQTFVLHTVLTTLYKIFICAIAGVKILHYNSTWYEGADSAIITWNFLFLAAP